jgi:hypothetical protein
VHVVLDATRVKSGLASELLGTPSVKMAGVPKVAPFGKLKIKVLAPALRTVGETVTGMKTVAWTEPFEPVKMPMGYVPAETEDEAVKVRVNVLEELPFCQEDTSPAGNPLIEEDRVPL